MARSTMKSDNDRWIPFRIINDRQIRIKTRGAHRRGEQISGIRYECEDRTSLDPKGGARSLSTR
jgi:hypothetical protein